MKSNYKKIGNFVRQTTNRNTDLKVMNLKGINIEKEFMPSVANINGTDLSKYKVVKKGQFAFNPMHVGRDEMLPIGLWKEEEPIIVSPAYIVFEIIDHDVLSPDYLMMWCSRKEFDRNCWFTTDSSVRGGFSWNDLCEMEFPYVEIQEQNKIVDEFSIINKRIMLLQTTSNKLETVADSLYKEWFVDFNFPINSFDSKLVTSPSSSSISYKKLNGKMVWNEELQQDIPIDWEVGTLQDIYSFQYGKGNNNPDNGGKYPVYGSNGIIGYYDEFNSEDAPVIGHIGANCGSVIYAPGKHYVTYNGVICNIKKEFGRFFGYLTLKYKDLQSQTRGSSQPFVSYDMLYEIKTVLPPKNIESKASDHFDRLYKHIILLNSQIIALNKIKDLILLNLSKI